MKYDNGLIIKNKFLYLILSQVLYFVIYILITFNFKGFFLPLLGCLFISGSIYFDYCLSAKNIRIFIRFLLVLFSYFILKYFIYFVSYLLSPKMGYNIFIDKLPFIFNRDTLIAIFLIIFYFTFDSVKLKEFNKIRYFISTVLMLIILFFIFKLDLPVNKTVYKNNFVFAFVILLTFSILFFRHAIFYLTVRRKKFEKRNLLFLLPLLIIFITILFFVVLPDNLGNQKSGGLFNQGIFQFDFSKLLKLEEELKLSDDRVLNS